jgi:hypothetical protein
LGTSRRWRLSFTDAKIVEGFVNLRVDAPEVRAIHITRLEKIDQIAYKFRPKLLVRHVNLNHRPDIAEQVRACTPAHDAPPTTAHRALLGGSGRFAQVGKHFLATGRVDVMSLRVQFNIGNDDAASGRSAVDGYEPVLRAWIE